MIDLTETTTINFSWLLAEFNEQIVKNQRATSTWTPESTVKQVTTNGIDKIYIHIQDDQYIKVTVDEYLLYTAIGDRQWKVYGVSADDSDLDLDFEPMVVDRIFADIRNNFN